MSEQVKPKHYHHFFNMRFTSVVSISLVLFIVGLIAFLFLLANKITVQTKENVVVTVVLKETADSVESERLGNYFSVAPYVKTFEYVSKEEALKEHVEVLGDDPSEFLGYNPLLSAYELKVGSIYANNDSLSKIENRILTFDSVYKVNYQKDMLQLLNQNVNRLGLFLSVIALVLLFISIVLMNNTIRLSIYSKRFLINTMKLVGAKPSFIRRPFIRQSIGMGFISIFMSLCMLIGFIYYLHMEIGGLFVLFDMQIILSVSAVVFVFGVLITWIASAIAVNRYVRLRTDALYYI